MNEPSLEICSNALFLYFFLIWTDHAHELLIKELFWYIHIVKQIKSLVKEYIS